MVTAELSMDNNTWKLDFKTNNVFFQNIKLSNKTQRILTAIMTTGSETYTLYLSVFDENKGITSFKLTEPISEGEAIIAGLKTIPYLTQN